MDSLTACFEDFLLKEDIGWEKSSGGLYIFPGKGLSVELVPLGGSAAYVADGRKYLYEDVWWRREELVRKRLLAHLGRFRSVFARKCEVCRLDTPAAGAFLSQYHTYGSARSKYRYGLSYRGELVAVASFSGARPMMREKSVQSFEWVRYASLPDTRVVGGMGKLMMAFVEDICPEEIMSYSDLEWSDGEVYRKLGFEEAGRRASVDFYIDSSSWERIPLNKLSSDKAFRDRALDPGTLVRISNMGSVKYLRRF
ncbi:MAG: hypothetical protein KBT00_00650 [Bacteroidales bacterium]|nr:hypothetical protein [Candidatus Cacconaster merdequi]